MLEEEGIAYEFKSAGDQRLADFLNSLAHIGFVHDQNNQPRTIENPAVVPRAFGPFGGQVWVTDEDYPDTVSTVPGAIHAVDPGVFFYWVSVTAPAGNNTFTITQTITTGNFNSFFDMANGGSDVFDSNCNSVHPTITQNADTTTVQWNAATAGPYIISIKYSASSSQPGNNCSLRLHDRRRAWFDQWARSAPAVIKSQR